MLMDSFEVENFRSLKHLKLEKLARVNLLVGKNNVGKTSVLEGLYLFTGTNVFSWIDHLDTERRMETIGFAFLFYKFNPENIVSIKAHIKPGQYVSQVSNPYDITATIQAVAVSRLTNALLLPGLLEGEALEKRNAMQPEGIEKIMIVAASTENIHATPSHQDYSLTQYLLDKERRRDAMGKQLLRPTLGHWLGTRVSYTNLFERLEYLQIKKQETQLIELMQSIDSRIEKIILGGNNTIYFDLGSDFHSLMPINLMGEGVQKLLAILATMAHTIGAIVQIDEIDDGLHYTALRVLWKAVLKAARQYDVQVFATTHSAEALRHLTWVLDNEENISYRDDVAAYTLIRAKDDTVRSFRYDYEQLDFAMEHDMEVRN